VQKWLTILGEANGAATELGLEAACLLRQPQNTMDSKIKTSNKKESDH
jgi:hypothetical protein